jgi:glutathionylspermidine amidase/synthetase
MRHSLRKNKTSRLSKVKIIVHNSKKKTACVTKFGKKLGYFKNVPAFSNCNNSFKSDLNNFINYKNENVFSGMQWQCVEYARRYLITKLGVTFSSVNGAEDVFALKTVESIQDGKKYKFKTYKNNFNCQRSNNIPKVNDVIIWARNQNDTPYGHIAVILKIEGDKIYIGEQNWSNDAWTRSSPPHSYSRILTLKTNNNRCSIIDGNYTILGWKRASLKREIPISLINSP